MTKQEFLDKVDSKYVELQKDKKPDGHGYTQRAHQHIRSNQVKALIYILLELCEEEKLLDLEAHGN